MSFFCIAVFIQCIAIHNSHMGKYRSVFLFSISKPEHSSQIKFFFMEIGIQAISSCLTVKKIFIRTFTDRLNLIFLCGFTHDRKYLTGKHHTYLAVFCPFHRTFMIIIISVEPAVFSVFYPFSSADVFHHPICLFIQIPAKLVQTDHNSISADIMCTFFCVLSQKLLLFLRAFIKLTVSGKQDFHFFRNFNPVKHFLFLKFSQIFCDVLHISSICTGKCHTLTIFPCHIHGIVPVCPVIFQQNVFQNRSVINLTGFCFLIFSIGTAPFFIMRSSSFCLKILEIWNLLKKDIHIPGLIHIKLRCHKWPESMIHPHAGNVVAVCDKFTLSVSDDRGIGSIDAYSTVIIDDHLTYNRRIHDQKCQTVLPEITPASSTFSIIMIREE